MSFLNKVWYGNKLTSLCFELPLLPVSALFAFITATRRAFYGAGILKRSGPVVPVVVVGGITVGGTGKTPLCIALVKELRERGFNPGILSRGYKAQCTNFPAQVPLNADPKIYGDEPSLMRRQCKAPVVIDPVRVRGADYLAGLGVDVIITDDGMQHYALDRDIEICVLDGSRMLGNKKLLPAGPLREGAWRLKSVNYVVVSGAVAHLGYHPMLIKHSSIEPLNSNSKQIIEPRSEVCALCGIGNPDRFYKSLEDSGFVVKEKVELGDHNKISFDKLCSLVQNRPVIMTAKDAIKYQSEATANNLNNVFVFNIQASLSKQFFDDVATSIKLNSHKVEQRRKEKEAQGYVLQKVEPISDDICASTSTSAGANASASTGDSEQCDSNKEANLVKDQAPASLKKTLKGKSPLRHSDPSKSSSLNSELIPDESSAQDQDSNSAQGQGFGPSSGQSSDPSAGDSTSTGGAGSVSANSASASSVSASASSTSYGVGDDKAVDLFRVKKAKAYDPSQLPKELKRR